MLIQAVLELDPTGIVTQLAQDTFEPIIGEIGLGSAALNVGLSLALIPAFGIVGAAFAILVNSLVLVPVFILYVRRAGARARGGGIAQRS